MVGGKESGNGGMSVYWLNQGGGLLDRKFGGGELGKGKENE